VFQSCSRERIFWGVEVHWWSPGSKTKQERIDDLFLISTTSRNQESINFFFFSFVKTRVLTSPLDFEITELEAKMETRKLHSPGQMKVVNQRRVSCWRTAREGFGGGEAGRMFDVMVDRNRLAWWTGCRW
jgi:hypothetical protein